MRDLLVGVQTISFFGLGAVLFSAGESRLGVAQVLLGIVTGLVYL